MRNFIDQTIVLNSFSKSGEKVRLTQSSELMENYATGKVIDGKSDQQVQAIYDSNGFPITFSISSDKGLFMILKGLKEGPYTGASQFDLTRRLGDGLEIEAFGVGQRKDGAFFLVVSGRKKGENKILQTFMTSWLVNDPAAMPWANSGKLWIGRENHALPNEGDAILRLLVGQTDMDAEIQKSGPLVVAVTQENNNVRYARINAHLSEPGSWNALSLGVDAVRIRDMRIGKNVDGVGVYYISQNANENHLRFSSIPYPNEDPIHLDLPMVKGAMALDVLPENEEGHTGLYVGGKGIHYLAAKFQEEKRAKTAEFTVLADGKSISGIVNLSLQQDKGNIAVWALDGEGALWSMDGEKGNAISPSSWTCPLPIKRGIKLLAPIRNQVKTTNDVVLITSENGLERLTQSTETTGWASQSIAVEDSGRLQQYTSYSTQLTFQDDAQRLPYAKEEVEITASEWCEITVNGKTVVIDSEKGHRIKPDVQGVITIVSATKGANTPVFRVKAAKDEFVVNPAAKLDDGLKGLESEADLLKAKRQNGEPLLKEGAYDPKDLPAIAEAMKNLNTSRTKLPKNGRASKEYLDEISDEASSQASWGMRISNEGRCQYFQGQAAQVMMSDSLQSCTHPLMRSDQSGEVTSIWRAAGMVLEWMKNAIVKAVEFLVEQVGRAWKIIVKIGEVAFQFFIECLEHAYKLADWLLEKTLGLKLKDILDWVGFLFDLKDAAYTSKVVSNVGQQTMLYCENQFGHLREQVDGVFNDLKGKVDQLKPLDFKGVGDQGLLAARNGVQDKLTPKGKNAIGFGEHSPASNLFRHHMTHSIPPKSNTDLFELSPAAMRELEGIGERLKALLVSFTDSAEGFGEDFKEFFKGGASPNVFLQKVMVRGLKSVLDLIQKVVQLIFELLASLFKALKKMMFKPLNIPLLSALYTHLTGQKDANLIEMICFPLMLPVTTLFKLFTGKAPFPNGESGGLDTAGYEELISRFKGAKLQAPGTEMMSYETILKHVLAVSGTFLGLVNGFIGIATAELGGDSNPFIGGISATLNFLGFMSSIPIGQWNWSSTLVWIADFIPVIKSYLGLYFPTPNHVSSVLDILAAIPSFIVQWINFGVSLGENWGKFPEYIMVYVQQFNDLIDHLQNVCTGAAVLIASVEAKALLYSGAAFSLHLKTLIGFISNGVNLATDIVRGDEFMDLQLSD